MSLRKNFACLYASQPLRDERAADVQHIGYRISLVAWGMTLASRLSSPLHRGERSDMCGNTRAAEYFSILESYFTTAYCFYGAYL